MQSAYIYIQFGKRDTASVHKLIFLVLGKKYD